MKNKLIINLLSIILFTLIILSFSSTVFANTDKTISESALEESIETNATNNTPAISPSSSKVSYVSAYIGSSNYSSTQVRYLQKELNAILGTKFDTNGKMTSELRKAIKQFQEKYNLEVDGLVGPNTRNMLNSIYRYKKVIVSVNVLNIRLRPTTSSPKISEVHKGDILGYIRTNWTDGETWYKISYNGLVGYVYGKYTKDTFIEVDITSQTLRLYKNRNLVLDTAITTGKKGSYDTQKGYYPIMFIDKDRILKPSGSHVDYWMRFNDAKAQGIHDASWRGNTENFNYFGGDIYKRDRIAGTKYSGSQGCVNIPPNKMPYIYENTGLGTPVYVH